MSEYPSIQPVQQAESPGQKDLPKVTTVSGESKQPLDGYIKELFEMGEAQNHFNMPSLIHEIDIFVRSEIERQGLKSDKKSYEEIIHGYEKRLNLPEEIDVYTRTEKIVSLIRIDAKLINAIKEKEELLNGDVTKMSSSQIKRYLKEKYEQSSNNN